MGTKFYSFILLAILFTACTNDEDVVDPQNEVPAIQSEAIYDVILEEDVIYGEGLSHDSINSAGSTVMSLKLDVYLPDNEVQNRPAFLFIHGGGFTGGSKRANNAGILADYYTARGWVFVSIDYRLRDDLGTVPEEWVTYAENLTPDLDASQFLAIYPAHRDAKAALRWLVANAATYNINTDYITIGGGSAGAITAISLGISNEEDFRDELTTSQDPTLSSTSLSQSYKIQTIVDFWGSKIGLDIIEDIYGHQRFDANDPPLYIAHGMEDPTVLFSEGEALKAIYDSLGLAVAYYPLEGAGHGAWNATVDGKRLEELAFDFIVEQQALTVE
ncbi:MAG: alpha/beta hydrolase [Bacteroidota bacterium]